MIPRRSRPAGPDEPSPVERTCAGIASRCGVFAKSDLQPLINQGAAGEDLAASVLQAVVTQTIAGLDDFELTAFIAIVDTTDYLMFTGSTATGQLLDEQTGRRHRVVDDVAGVGDVAA